MHQNHLEGVLKHKLLGVTSRVSDSVGVGWAEKSALLTTTGGKGGGANATGQGTRL